MRRRCSSPAGQIAIAPAMALEVAAAWMAQKPPMLEPRTQTRSESTRSCEAKKRAILATSPRAAGLISSADSPCPRWS